MYDVSESQLEHKTAFIWLLNSLLAFPLVCLLSYSGLSWM